MEVQIESTTVIACLLTFFLGLCIGGVCLYYYTTAITLNAVYKHQLEVTQGLLKTDADITSVIKAGQPRKDVKK